MKRSVARVLGALSIVCCFSGAASAAPVSIGLLSFVDLDGVPSFSITNYTGLSAFPEFGYPIETLLTFTVTSLAVATDGDGPPPVAGSAFTTDEFGNLNCTATGFAEDGGCDFGPYQILSATLTGTLTPLTGLIGLPSGYSAIEANFTTTLAATPDCGAYLSLFCSSATIEATLVPNAPVGVPEPSAAMLLQVGMGLLVSSRLKGKRSLGKRLRQRR